MDSTGRLNLSRQIVLDVPGDRKVRMDRYVPEFIRAAGASPDQAKALLDGLKKIDAAYSPDGTIGLSDYTIWRRGVDRVRGYGKSVGPAAEIEKAIENSLQSALAIRDVLGPKLHVPHARVMDITKDHRVFLDEYLASFIHRASESADQCKAMLDGLVKIDKALGGKKEVSVEAYKIFRQAMDRVRGYGESFGSADQIRKSIDESLKVAVDMHDIFG